MAAAGHPPTQEAMAGPEVAAHSQDPAAQGQEHRASTGELVLLIAAGVAAELAELVLRGMPVCHSWLEEREFGPRLRAQRSSTPEAVTANRGRRLLIQQTILEIIPAATAPVARRVPAVAVAVAPAQRGSAATAARAL